MKVLFELYDSAKPLNNVITSLALRPDRVVFLGDRRLNQPSRPGAPNKWRESILRVFEGAHLHCDVEWISAETSYEAIYDALEQSIDLYEGAELIADATGGSEYMLLALGGICAKRELSVIAYHPASRAFVQLVGAPFDVESLPVPRFSVAQAIALGGGELLKQDHGADIVDNPDAMALIAPMMEYCRENSGTWSALNRYFKAIQLQLNSDGTYDAPRIFNSAEDRFPLVDATLTRLKEIGALRYLTFERQKRVIDLTYREMLPCLYMEGLVLELYIYQALKDCGAFDDVRMSCHLSWDNDTDDLDTTNEVDAIATSGIGQFYVSCKVGMVDQWDMSQIASVTSRFGNGYATPVLVCLRPLQLDPVQYRRARDMGIEVIDSEDLSPEKLKNRLKNLAAKWN